MTLKFRSLVLAGALAVGAGFSAQSVQAQNAVLAEMYGRGVHAYYSGNHTDAFQFLSMAIENGLKDPRAYYFRGLTAYSSGREYEAEADWQAGAEIEASGRTSPAIGQSLARIQGPGRLKLEEHRQRARLQALAVAASRSQVRYGEINAAQPPASAPVAGGAAPAVAPPPAPTAASGDNPFADDLDMSAEPRVESNDAFGNVLDRVPMDDAAPAAGDAAAPGAADPFGAPPADGADPFGAPAAGAADPFGGAAGGDAAGGEMADPFGSDPFGN